jgi:hypothetical protein
LNIQHLQAEINAIHQDTAQIDDSAGRAIVKRLLNLVERLAGENAALESERQALRDEINRLKGEQGKPDIKADKRKTGDISSEAERKEAEANATKGAGSGDGGAAEEAGGKKTRRREAKLPKIKIDREKICPLDKAGLPDDLEFKGYEDVVVQDLVIVRDNVKYRREVYYSPSQRKSYRGELPEGVRGQGGYGPGIRALIPMLKSRRPTSPSNGRAVTMFSTRRRATFTAAALPTAPLPKSTRRAAGSTALTSIATLCAARCSPPTTTHRPRTACRCWPC